MRSLTRPGRGLRLASDLRSVPPALGGWRCGRRQSPAPPRRGPRQVTPGSCWGYDHGGARGAVDLSVGGRRGEIPHWTPASTGHRFARGGLTATAWVVWAGVPVRPRRRSFLAGPELPVAPPERAGAHPVSGLVGVQLVGLAEKATSAGGLRATTLVVHGFGSLMGWPRPALRRLDATGAVMAAPLPAARAPRPPPRSCPGGRRPPGCAGSASRRSGHR